MIKNEAEIFGLIFLGYGATISRCPWLDILDSGKNIPVAVFENCWLSSTFSWWQQKYGTLICNQFLKHMKKIDPTTEF